MLRELLSSGRLVKASGWRDASTAIGDYQRGSPGVRFRRRDGARGALRMARDGSLVDMVNSLLRFDNLERLAELVDEADGVVIDGGANSGLFSALVKQRHAGARVIAVEANPDLDPIIRQNLAPYGNWNLVVKALTDRPGNTTFYRNHQNPQLSALTPATAWGPAEAISVASTSVDALADEFALDRIDVLKLDVQGAEAQAIAGAERMLHRTRKVLVEVSMLETTPEDLLIQLREEFGKPVVLQPVLSGADLLYTRS